MTQLDDVPKMTWGSSTVTKVEGHRLQSSVDPSTLALKHQQQHRTSDMAKCTACRMGRLLASAHLRLLLSHAECARAHDHCVYMPANRREDHCLQRQMSRLQGIELVFVISYS